MRAFITGATGYLGGEGLFALERAHPDWEFNLLVRDEEKGKSIKETYPNVNLIYGTLNDAKIIEEAASKADLVLHTAESADHEISARAIAKGLLAGHTASKPGYWIHISGAANICWYDIEHKRYGQPPIPEEAYDDVEGVDRLLNLPDSALHRNIDKIVLETAAVKPEAVKVAIVCPPTIYGPGRGPVKKRSFQLPYLAASTLELGYAPVTGTGESESNGVHVGDLGELFVLLAATATGGKHPHEDEIWGPKAYYFAENDSFAWGDVAKQVAQVAAAKGYIHSAQTKSFSAEEMQKTFGLVGLTLSWNSRSTAKRARKYLGWTPKGESLKDTIPYVIEDEAKRLGKV